MSTEHLSLSDRLRFGIVRKKMLRNRYALIRARDTLIGMDNTWRRSVYERRDPTLLGGFHNISSPDNIRVVMRFTAGVQHGVGADIVYYA